MTRPFLHLESGHVELPKPLHWKQVLVGSIAADAGELLVAAPAELIRARQTNPTFAMADSFMLNLSFLKRNLMKQLCTTKTMAVYVDGGIIGAGLPRHLNQSPDRTMD